MLYIYRPTPTTSRIHIAKSILKKHKFKHNFQNFRDTLCSCENTIESAIPFFLHCANLPFHKETLLNETHTIDPQILTQEAAFFSKTFLFKKLDFKNSLIKDIINATLGFILTTEHPLFSNWHISLWDTSISLSLSSPVLLFLILLISFLS